ncbi:MAG: ribosome silencing factor [Prolixibacteraceae bacterium]|nr:ribosome silencing factor [Prolixibacteraceae bacterium]
MDVKLEETEILITNITEGIQKVKGKNIVQIDLTTINHTECSHFIICNGTSNTHTVAIAESVEEYVEEISGTKAFHKEGYKNGIWILLDYGDIMVHVFREEARDFYNLEKLWADAKITNIIDE